jgi:UDP-GlcNAc:undecaprenyl-phosphate GlcNAc-1-phosphate transferase
MSLYARLLICGCTSFALAAVLIPLAKAIAWRFNVVAEPNHESGHPRPTPVLGGIAIVIAVLTALALVGALPLWMLAGTGLLLGVGVADDAVALTPSHKFILEALVVTVFLSSGPPLPEITRWPLVNAIGVAFYMLAVINAFNLVDGLDGLASGVGIMAASAVGVVAWWSRDAGLAYAATATVAAFGAFLLFNFHPASIFMGDSGALPMGFLLGALALEGSALEANSHLSKAVFPLFVMLVPLLDTSIVTISRIATSNPISRRGLDHSHHRLLMLGLSVRRAVLVSWAFAAAGAVCAAGLTFFNHAYLLSVMPFLIVLIGVAGLFMIDLTFEGQAPAVAYGYVRGAARYLLSFAYKRRLAEAALDLALIPAAYFGAFLLRRDFMMNDGIVGSLIRSTPVILVATYAAFALTGVYRGIWRYAGLADIIRFANGALLAGTFITIASLFVPIELSGSIIVLYAILLFNLLAFTRLSFQTLRRAIAMLALPTERVLIVGAGRTGEAAVHYIFSGNEHRSQLVGFVDDDAFKAGKLVHGRAVLGPLDDLERIYAATGFHRILIAADNIGEDRLALVAAFANTRELPIERFSIAVSRFVAAVNDAVTANTPGKVIPRGKSSAPEPAV